MIRVAVLDRHPAVRAGLAALLRGAPGVSPVGSSLYGADPDVVVVDDLSSVRRVRRESPRARVILYVAAPGPFVVMAALVAGADGVVAKEGDELLPAIRSVVAGERVFPPV